MEPQSGIIFGQNQPMHRLRNQPDGLVERSYISVVTYHVCPHLLCLSPPISSVPTFYVRLIDFENGVIVKIYKS